MNVVFFGGPKDKNQIYTDSCPAAIYCHGDGFAWAFDISAHQYWLSLGFECNGVYYLTLKHGDNILYVWNGGEINGTD